VDDEFILRDLMRTILESEGFSVITASDGDEAITKANSEMPDLILLDLMMPGKSGLEVCKILKSQSETKKIPVVMTTVLGREVDRALTKEAGADAHFIKPFSAFALLTEVRRQLDKAKECKLAKEFGSPLAIERHTDEHLNVAYYDLTCGSVIKPLDRPRVCSEHDTVGREQITNLTT